MPGKKLAEFRGVFVLLEKLTPRNGERGGTIG